MTPLFGDVAACASRLDLWVRLIGRVRPGSMLELGVWKGEFAAHVLAHCPSVGRYYMVDPWRTLPSWNKPLNVAEADFEAAYRAAMDATQFAGKKLTVLRGTTREVIDRIPDTSLDLAYVDGDHTLRGISIDLISVYPKIKPGGFLGGDDFNREIWQHGVTFEPTLVFPFAVYFAEAVGAQIHGLPFNQFVIEKPLSPNRSFKFIDHTGSYQGVQLRDQLLHVEGSTGPLRRIAQMVKRMMRLTE